MLFRSSAPEDTSQRLLSSSTPRRSFKRSTFSPLSMTEACRSPSSTGKPPLVLLREFILSLSRFHLPRLFLGGRTCLPSLKDIRNATTILSSHVRKGLNNSFGRGVKLRDPQVGRGIEAFAGLAFRWIVSGDFHRVVARGSQSINCNRGNYYDLSRPQASHLVAISYSHTTAVPLCTPPQARSVILSSDSEPVRK